MVLVVQSSSPNDSLSLPRKMLAAGVAGCWADLVTFPLDTAKVRLQVQGERAPNAGVVTTPQYRGMMRTITTIALEEGPRGLYNGLNAGLQRQLCFASIRIGTYDCVKGFYQDLLYGPDDRDGMHVLTRTAAGITTGALAVVTAQPTDVVKVRFQAQKGSARYNSTFRAYSSIAKKEGVSGLWKGTVPNIGRNAIVNVSEIVCYDIIKDTLLRRGLMTDNMPCHFVSAVTAGFAATFVASPVDVIKTRYMNSPPGQYRGAIDCAVKTALQEGFIAFYKGFTPSFARLVAWNIVMWMSFEQLKRLFSVS